MKVTACWVAVAQAYGAVHDVSYHDTPAIAVTGDNGREQQAAWEAWALERGLRWWMSYELAPAHLAAWLGSVDSRAYPGAQHVIAFDHERSMVPEGSGFADVTIGDVRCAKWLLPAGVEMPAGTMRRIERPEKHEPRGVVYQDASGRWQWAMRTRRSSPGGWAA